MTFNEIVKMIVSACNHHFYNGTRYDGLNNTIIECATKIYIEQMKNEERKSM